MSNQPAAIGCGQNGPHLIPDNVRVGMVLSRLMGIGQSTAGAEHHNGHERDDGSQQHDFYPLSDWMAAFFYRRTRFSPLGH
jgi:hypothetical protein